MAINTRSKRASSVALFGLLAAPVLPDGTISQGDRQHIAFSYSGILAATVYLTASEIIVGGKRKRDYEGVLRQRVYQGAKRKRDYTIN